MKLIQLIAIAFIAIFIFSGCGQQMDVTIYNTSGVTYSGGLDETYIQITTQINNIEGTNNTFFPSGYCLTESGVDASNSITLSGRENETLNVYAVGQYYTVDSIGNTSITAFEVSPVQQVLYGDFLESPHWYAAVFIDSIVIYKR